MNLYYKEDIIRYIFEYVITTFLFACTGLLLGAIYGATYGLLKGNLIQEILYGLEIGIFFATISTIFCFSYFLFVILNEYFRGGKE